MVDNLESNSVINQQVSEKISSADVQKKSVSVFKITTIIFLLLFLVTGSTTIYFYSKYISEKNNQKTGKIANTSITPSPTVSSISTPTPIDYLLEDPSIKENYFPVQYNSYSKQQQKVAQTFTLDNDLTISAVKLKASFGVGNNINLEIYEAGNVKDLTTGTLVGKGIFSATDIVKEAEFEIILEKASQLKANKEYAMVISASDTKTQTAIAFSEDDILKNGFMYKFTRLEGGNGEIISNIHTWQPIKNQDLLYVFKEF